MSILSRIGDSIYLKVTDRTHPTSCRKDTERDTTEGGVDVGTDPSAADEKGSGAGIFTSLPCPRMGES